METNKAGVFLNQLNQITGKALNFLSMLALAGMLLLTVADVLLRYFLKKPIIGGTELTQSFLVCMALGLGWSVLSGKEIKMDMIVSRLPPMARRMIDTVTLLLGMAVILIITYGFWREIPSIKFLMMSTAALRIPEYIFFFILAIGFSYFFIVMVVLFLKNILGMVKNES